MSGVILPKRSDQWLILYHVAKKVYHPILNDNFHSSCPIPEIFGTILTDYNYQLKHLSMAYLLSNNYTKYYLNRMTIFKIIFADWVVA